MLSNLITDRSQADVEAVKGLAEAIKQGTATEEQVQQYLNVHQKGAYTYEDLNRVEAAVLYVAKRLQEYGYLRKLPITRVWTMTDKPNSGDLIRYIANVEMLRNTISTLRDTPTTPTSMENFDVVKANALEQILVDIDQVIDHMKDVWFYMGDLYLAEV